MTVAAKSEAHSKLYEVDFARWAEEQARALAGRRETELDWDNLAEEIESLGRRERAELRSRLIVLLTHLLKWQFQPQRRSHSWQTTIGEQRVHIEGILETSPSLKAFPREILSKCFQAARREAIRETNLPAEVFPKTAPFSVEQVVDYGFMPGPPWSPDDLSRD